MSGTYLHYSHPGSQHLLTNDSAYGGYLRTGRHVPPTQRRQPSKQLLSASSTYDELGYNPPRRGGAPTQSSVSRAPGHASNGHARLGTAPPRGRDQNGASSLSRPPGGYHRSGRESPNLFKDRMAIDIPSGHSNHERGMASYETGTSLYDSISGNGNTPPCKHRRGGPLIKLTQGLLKTYKAINKRYYEAKNSKKDKGKRQREQKTTTAQRVSGPRTHPQIANFARQQAPASHGQPRQRTQPAQPGPASTRHPGPIGHGPPAQPSMPVKVARDPMEYMATRHQRNSHHKPSQSHAQSYHHETKPDVKPLPVDTPDHDYIIRPGDILNEKYCLEKQIDKGCFGVVVLAKDRRTNAMVAIKIIKAKPAFFKQAQTEIDILSHLNYNDPADNQRVVRLFEVFIHKNHRCLVFELLSHSLYKLLKDTNFKGVSLTLVRKFTYQLLISLQFLRLKHPKGIIHADLKPENILLVSPERSQIKVIDFGSSCFEDRKMYSYIQSRFYRAPEVLLGKVYSYPIDMWSLGCILIELHTGEPVFPGLSEEDQLCKVITILGMPPKTLLHHAKKKDKFFIQTKNGMQLKRPPPKNKKNRKDDYALRQSPILPLSELKRRTFEDAVVNARRRRRNEVRDHSPKEYEQFLHLIKRMLVWEPNRRITPEEALAHPWIQPIFQKEQAANKFYGPQSSTSHWPGPNKRQAPGPPGQGYALSNPALGMRRPTR